MMSSQAFHGIPRNSLEFWHVLPAASIGPARYQVVVGHLLRTCAGMPSKLELSLWRRNRTVLASCELSKLDGRTDLLPVLGHQ